MSQKQDCNKRYKPGDLLFDLPPWVLGAIFAEPVSLAQPFGENGNLELEDVLAAIRQPSLDEVVIRNQIIAAVWDAVNALSPKERMVILLRFGIEPLPAGGPIDRTVNHYHEASLKQVGWAMGCTRQNIAQLEKKAMKRLKKNLRLCALTENVPDRG